MIQKELAGTQLEPDLVDLTLIADNEGSDLGSSGYLEPEGRAGSTREEGLNSQEGRVRPLEDTNGEVKDPLE